MNDTFTDNLCINGLINDNNYLLRMEEQLKGVKDFSNVCRICASVVECIYPIFEEGFLSNNLAGKINKYLPINVIKEDGLPQVVCYQCQNMVLEWDKLVQCTTQAKMVLEHKLSLMQQILDPDKKPNIEEICTDHGKILQTGERRSFDFITVVKDVLANYYHALNIEEDNSDLEYVCQLCPENPISRDTESLADHLKSSHTSVMKNKICIETFIRDNITFEEALVTDDFDDGAEVIQNLKDKELPTYYCPFCESVFSSPNRLICHLTQHIDICFNEGVICCDNLYKKKLEFVSHLQNQHVSRANESTVEPHICKTCGISARDIKELQMHIDKNHSEGIKSCEKKEKMTHSSKCQKYIPVVCPNCNKVFSNKYNLQVHMKSYTDKLTKFTCHKCNKNYKSQGSLSHHQKVAHEGVLRFLCPICGEAFPTRGTRDVHARIHSGLKPFTCDLCGKSYRAKNTLDRHMDMHLDIRKYSCHLCSKKFRKKAHLNYHVKTHMKGI